MLTHLEIRDLVIVDHVELELEPGMTVLTGETGAGKSILVDALGLVLGGRASTTVVRAGAARAEVSAELDPRSPGIAAWLAARELDAPDGECILRRSVTADGRSRGYINGRPVPLQSLREIGALLVDIHGQHAHHSLLRRDTQRQLLDAFGGHEQALVEIAEAWQGWRRTLDELADLGGSPEERAAEADLLRYQVHELRELAITPEEPAELDREHARLSHAGHLLEGARRAHELLDGDQALTALAQLDATLRELDDLLEYDDALEEPRAAIESAAIQVREVATDLRRYAQDVDLDPERLAWVEQRIAEIYQLARKHRVGPEALPALREQLERQLHDLEHGDERRQELEAEQERLLERYRSLAEDVHQARVVAAARLSETVTGHMRQLGMPGGRLEVRVQRATGSEPSRHGDDRVELLVSANPGQALQPLAKVASGGELSRISLAIQVVGARGSGVPTLIFDEVDVGIGGGVAELVGQHLRTLAHSRQVLCITHLPQVASQGRHHLTVSKTSREGATYTQVSRLSARQRVDEVARMLGGVEITAQTLAHAREMLERAEGD